MCLFLDDVFGALKSIVVIHDGRRIGNTIAVELNVDKIEGVELKSLNYAIKNADILVILVDHKEFRSIDKSILLDKCIIDTKGII